jgi:hypothetical protein
MTTAYPEITCRPLDYFLDCDFGRVLRDSLLRFARNTAKCLGNRFLFSNFLDESAPLQPTATVAQESVRVTAISMAFANFLVGTVFNRSLFRQSFGFDLGLWSFGVS